jgi:5-methylcytosine-specific restriction endonuclease McrA
MNYYNTSSGERVSEATIKARLSAAYREFYLFEPLGNCEGCGEPATCTAHIVPKSRLKHLHKTEYIWNPIDWFRSCFRCNQIAENPESAEIKTLMNYDRILEVTRKLDPERYNKMIL